jgi:hypothetical protein
MMIKNLQKDFDNLNLYLRTNELYININKTCFMPITTSHMSLGKVNIIAHNDECLKHNHCNCELINTVENAKYLGLEIDKTGNFIDTLITLL